MLIKIKGKEYEFKYGWGAMYLFEATVPNQRFNPKHPAHLHLMFFCMLMNANKGMQLTQEDFVEALDTQPQLTRQLTEAFELELKKWSEVQGYGEEDEEGKKKAEND